MELFRELSALDPDDPRREQVRNDLVTQYSSIAEHIAQRFAHRGQPKDDLTQVAQLGLINAVDRYDADRGSDFLSFAVPTVMGEVRRYFRDSTWSMRVPRRLKELHLQINTATAELFQRSGHAPRPSELAEYLQITLEEVYEGIEAAGAYQPLSVDLPSGSDSTRALIDRMGGEDPAIDRVDYHESLSPLIAELPDRERRILQLRFVGNLTQSQIAAEVGMSQMHVSRLLAQSIKVLRIGLADTPAPD